MLRICEGKPNCLNQAQAIYNVTGWRTSFREREMVLCETCPAELEADRNEVVPKEKSIKG